MYDTYLKGISSDELAALQSNLGTADNKSLLAVIKQFYDEGNPQAIISMYTMDDSATKFKNVFNMLETQGNNVGLGNYFEQLYNLSEVFFEVNPNYSIDQLFFYATENEDAFTSGSYTSDDIINYYEEKGFTIDADETDEPTDQDKVDDALADAVDGLKNNQDDTTDTDSGQDPSKTAQDLVDLIKNQDDDTTDASSENNRQLEEEMTVEEAMKKAYANDDLKIVYFANGSTYGDGATVLLVSRSSKEVYVVTENLDDYVAYFSGERKDSVGTTYDDNVSSAARNENGDFTKNYGWEDNYNAITNGEKENNIDNVTSSQPTSYEETQPPLDDATQTSSYAPGYYVVPMNDGTYTVVRVNDDGTAEPYAEKLTQEQYKTQQSLDIIGEMQQDEWEDLYKTQQSSQPPSYDEVQPALDDATQTKPFLYAPGYYGVEMDDGKYTIMKVNDDMTTEVLKSNLSKQKYSATSLDGNLTEMTSQQWDDMTSSQPTSYQETQPPLDDATQTSPYAPGYYVVAMRDGTYSVVRVNDDGTADLYAEKLTQEQYKTQQSLDIIDELQQDEWEALQSDTNVRNLQESDDSIYAILNPDGTYKIVQVDKDGNAEVYDDALTQDEYDDLANDVDLDTVKDDDVQDEDWYEQIEPPESTEQDEEEEQPHPADNVMNDNINILQQVDNYGPVEINTTVKVADPNYQEHYDSMNAPTLAEIKYFKENDVNVTRLNDFKTLITTEEWDLIKESYKYDKDVTKPFEIKDGTFKDQKVEAKYSTNYVNEFEYFYELGHDNQFYRWLDARKAGVESRSYAQYALHRKLEASDIDVSNYVKSGMVTKLLPSINFLDQSMHHLSLIHI